jgi:hypothetical protein
LQKKNPLVGRARRRRPRTKTLPHHLLWKTLILAGRVVRVLVPAVPARVRVLAELEPAVLAQEVPVVQVERAAAANAGKPAMSIRERAFAPLNLANAHIARI